MNILALIFPWLGWIGVLIILVGTLASAVVYTGKQGERFSFLNHYVSELGEKGVSRWAALFNIGMIVGGVLMTFFLVMFGLNLSGFWIKLGAVTGLWAGISCIFVGVYPMNDLKTHGVAARSFFRSGLLTMLLFTLGIILRPTGVILPSAAIGGLAGVACYALFLFLTRRRPSAQVAKDSLDPAIMSVRPRVWAIAVVEWAVFFVTVGWFAYLALTMLGVFTRG